MGPTLHARALNLPAHTLPSTSPQGLHLPQGLKVQQETLAVIAATAPGPALVSFMSIFNLLKVRYSTSPQSCLERIVTLTLKERPPLLILLESTEPHIRLLWVTQYVTPYFV